MENEMIERVAEAISEERERWIQRTIMVGSEVCREADDGTYVVVAVNGDYDALTDLACGRAAIEAMRKPTEGMLDAACEVGPDTNSGPFSYDDARLVWAAMIGAAQTDKQPA